MSIVTFSPNEIVYVKGIGYAKLLDCGAKKTLQQFVPSSLEVKRQSMQFDPDLFNSDVDSNRSKKSQTKSQEEKQQVNLANQVSSSKNEKQIEKSHELVQSRITEDAINIVKARLEGTNAYIFTSDKNLSKFILIEVKLLLPNCQKQIYIEIDISKTIDTFKKNVFQHIHQPIESYYNIKLFAVSSKMQELSTPTKTIYQYLIKHGNRLILTADYAFGFQPTPSGLHCQSKITIKEHTLTSSKPLIEPKIPIIPLPIPPLLAEGTQAAEQSRQLKHEPKDEDVVSQPPITIIEEKKEHPNYLALCNIQLLSGRRYWEIKIQKIPSEENQLSVGVCVPSNNPSLTGSIEGCLHIWAYDLIAGRKNHIRHDEEGKLLEESQEEYGYVAAINDTIGVLAILKGHTALITFYKNSISCGLGFEIDLSRISQGLLQPFVCVGGEAQVVLNSKAQFPLDSYRLT